MTIQEWGARHAGVEILELGDPRVAELLRQTRMQDGDWGMELHRHPDPAAYFRRQGGRGFFLTLAAKPGAKMQALVSVILRQLDTPAGPAPFVFIGDARVTPDADRRLKARLREIYRDLIAEVPRIEGLAESAGILTAVLAGNHESLQAFARGRRGISYFPRAVVNTTCRLVVPFLSTRFWNFDRACGKYRVEFAPVSTRTRESGGDRNPDRIADRIEEFETRGMERIRVFGAAGRPVATAVWWTEPVREVEIYALPALWSALFRVLGVPRRLPLRWVSFLELTADGANESGNVILRAIFREALRSGRLRVKELVANRSFGGGREGPSRIFSQTIRSNVYSVGLVEPGIAPVSTALSAPPPALELEPAFL